MSNSIYVIWRLSLRPNAYEISKEDLITLRKKSETSLASVEGEMVLRLATHWANEKWQRAGVIKYPGIEALHTHTSNLENMGWFRFHKTETLPGIVTFHERIEMPDPIYVIWRLSLRPAFYNLSEEKVQQLLKVRDESLRRVGGKKVFHLDTRWSNEKWQYSGVVKYPSIASLQVHTKNLGMAGWYRAVETDTLPGIEIVD